ncbi:hypothetical protein OTU49_015687 [Cherax quadricarinatus]|uniref:Uncharacterized protein n=1 Tax=Cherax quadricarinatus TaxID=27406 RepID=A0AAW0YBJ4_CHEQU
MFSTLSAGRQQNQARMMTPIRPLDTVNAMTEQRTRDHVSGGRSSSPAVHACVKTSWSASSNMSSPATDHDHDPPNYDTAILQADVHREYKLSSGHHADRQFPGQLSSNCQADRQFPGQLSSNYHADRQFPGQLPSSYQADRQFPGQLPSNHHADRQPAGWR